jgi:hypothetical protein
MCELLRNYNTKKSLSTTEKIYVNQETGFHFLVFRCLMNKNVGELVVFHKLAFNIAYKNWLHFYHYRFYLIWPRKDKTLLVSNNNNKLSPLVVYAFH